MIIGHYTSLSLVINALNNIVRMTNEILNSLTTPTNLLALMRSMKEVRSRIPR